ncbi:hypothetical protein ACIA48_25510 [Mycobacterium sp. NPDC051804]|uniref:hypothetical protein n=1 Tax=Mycobacterium sp. NPDC051804 TaxID=3364295 RepID=UPI0037B88ED4
MKTGQKVIAFVVGLAVVFAVSVWIGNAVTPQESTATAAPELPGGLQTTQDGYTLALDNSIALANPDVPLKFQILSPTGAPVKRYVETHEKLLHLIVVRNDLAVFQHVHPTLDDQGTWSVPLNLSRAGDYRVFADFMPTGGPALTLGANLHVAGKYDPQPLPPAAQTAQVDDYTVTLRGTPRVNEASMLTLSVSRNGKPVDDLQPYLGAYGHLVAVRAPDLAYLHVHPMSEPDGGAADAGPEIGFHTTFPSTGSYRLFLDFQHGDVVRTAAFTVNVTEAASATEPAPAGDGGGHQH